MDSTDTPVAPKGPPGQLSSVVQIKCCVVLFATTRNEYALFRDIFRIHPIKNTRAWSKIPESWLVSTPKHHSKVQSPKAWPMRSVLMNPKFDSSE